MLFILYSYWSDFFFLSFFYSYFLSFFIFFIFITNTFLFWNNTLLSLSLSLSLPLSLIPSVFYSLSSAFFLFAFFLHIDLTISFFLSFSVLPLRLNPFFPFSLHINLTLSYFLSFSRETAFINQPSTTKGLTPPVPTKSRLYKPSSSAFPFGLLLLHRHSVKWKIPTTSVTQPRKQTAMRVNLPLSCSVSISLSISLPFSVWNLGLWALEYRSTDWYDWVISSESRRKEINLMRWKIEKKQKKKKPTQAAFFFIREIYIFLQSSFGPVDWGSRIHRLHLYGGVLVV